MEQIGMLILLGFFTVFLAIVAIRDFKKVK